MSLNDNDKKWLNGITVDYPDSLLVNIFQRDFCVIRVQIFFSEAIVTWLIKCKERAAAYAANFSLWITEQLATESLV